MRYFLDTEFDERGGAGRMDIQTISIGLVAEDGRELYMENADYSWEQPGIDPWLIANVRPHLQGGDALKAPEQITLELTEFFAGDDDIEVLAYFGDYDWVVLCSNFGRMIDLPEGMPKLCLDLKQRQKALGMPKSLVPADPTDAHHALADARWNRQLAAALDSYAASRSAGM